MTLEPQAHERGPRVNVDIDDTLAWNSASRRCLSAKTGRVVRWAELVGPTGMETAAAKAGAPRDVERRCCNLVTMMSARWHSFLEGNGEYDGGLLAAC